MTETLERRKLGVSCRGIGGKKGGIGANPSLDARTSGRERGMAASSKRKHV